MAESDGQVVLPPSQDTVSDKPTASTESESTEEKTKPESITEVDSQSKDTVAPAVPDANAYCPPIWASPCPVDSGYRLEVIKTGVPLPECTVHLSGREEPLSYCLFGRQPQQYCNPSGKRLGHCAVLAHPSISRLHAVLQYGRPPMSIARTASPEVPTEGWYIQDLDSTHGTFVNKRRLPPGRFIRIHVGYVIRFGGSTRLHVFEGPEEDQERQSSLSWTELKEAYKARKEGVKPVTSSLPSGGTTEMGCDWGMSAEDADTESANFLASLDSAACLSHEHQYRDDPKRALRAYFEREGIEPHPEFEFVEATFGKQHCKIELPLPSGTVVAEAIVSGKRKEAIAACALEACQLLDRLGEFDPNKDSSTSRKQIRTREYWEENAYYSSDEDTFIDRTGQVERKRLERIRQLGVEGETAQEAERRVAQLEESARKRTSELGSNKTTMLSVLSELEKVGKEIVELEEKLEEIDKNFMPNKDNPSELDELEAYMTALKSGAPTRKERLQLKSRLFSLRQTEMRLFHQAGLTQPLRSRQQQAADGAAGYRMDAAAAVRAVKRKLDEVASERATATDAPEQPTRNKRLLRNEIKRSLSSHVKPSIEINKTQTQHSGTDESEVEEDDEELEENAKEEPKKQESQKPAATKPQQPQHVLRQPERTPPIVKKNEEKEKPSANEQKAPQPGKTTPVIPVVVVPPRSPSPASPSAPHAVIEDRPPKVERVAPSIPEPLIFQTAEDSQMSTEAVIPNAPAPKRKKVADVYQSADPDYVTWVPPSDQTGDGTTALNAKYGY